MKKTMAMMEQSVATSCLAVVLLAATLAGVPARAAAALSGQDGVASGSSRHAIGPGIQHGVNLLYPEPTGFLREDVTNRTARFWLPDSAETGWRARDKKLHFFASYSIVLTGEAVTDRLETGVAWAAGLSVAKELWDFWFKTPASERGASKGDLVADAVGLVAAVIVLEASQD